MTCQHQYVRDTDAITYHCCQKCGDVKRDLEPTPQEQTQDSSTTSPDESPAGCGPLERWGKVPGPYLLNRCEDGYWTPWHQAADTIAALTKERDIWAEASKAKAERLTALQAENAELRKNYNELIMSVGRKFPDETRHQTALRYIQTTETQCIEGPASAAMKEGK